MREIKGSAKAIDMRSILSWRKERIWSWIECSLALCRLMKSKSGNRIMLDHLWNLVSLCCRLLIVNFWAVNIPYHIYPK
jgi:hypothetical protein